ALFGLLCSSLIVLQPSTVEAAQGDLQLIAQSFNVASDGSLTATLGLPAKLADTDLANASIAVTVYPRVNDRVSVNRIIGPPINPPLPDDVVTISPGCCMGPQPGQFTVSVPLEVSQARPDALSIPSAGLYPVTFAVLRGGQVMANVLSFVNRLPAAGESAPGDPLSVAVAIGTHSAVHLDSKATISLDPNTGTEMTALADTLDALNANKFPATVRVEPAVLNGLQQLNSDLFDRLIASLQLHQVAAEPQWPIDPSAAAAAKQDLLYASWLRDGEDRFAGLGLGPSVVSTASILVDQPIGAEGAALRRLGGAGLMVMSPTIYDVLPGTILIFSDNKGELVPAHLPDGAVLDTAVVDHHISDLLIHPLATPELTRIYAVAGLLALRQSILISGESAQRHAVVLGTPDLGVPDASLLGSITALITDTPGLAAATLDDVALRTDRLLLNGEEHPVTLPSSNGAALATRIFTQAALNNEIDAVAAMLPNDSERPKGWRDLTALLPTTALDDPAAEGMVTTIRSELADVRNAVGVPTPYTVNLAGKRSTVRIRFVNNSDTPLKIKIRLSSPSGKLVFTNNDRPVVLEPGVPLAIPIAVEARSNGTSGVSLDVFTPNDVPLVPTVPLKFRVNALGVGNVLTGVLFGLVLLWWLEHFRATRKKRRSRPPATLPES
ncbi:MAG: DUF6049 family protein, partial [Ilumatobacteraceae bacterium]